MPQGMTGHVTYTDKQGGEGKTTHRSFVLYTWPPQMWAPEFTRKVTWKIRTICIEQTDGKQKVKHGATNSFC